MNVGRFLADENFPLPVVEAMRELGHDVITLQEAGLAGMAVPDGEILEFARRDDRAVLSLNRKHFVALHRIRSEHAGIVVCTVDIDFVGQAERIAQAISGAPSLSGRLIRVNRPG